LPKQILNQECFDFAQRGAYPPARFDRLSVAFPSFVFAPQKAGRSAQDVWEGGWSRDGCGDFPWQSNLLFEKELASPPWGIAKHTRAERVVDGRGVK